MNPRPGPGGSSCAVPKNIPFLLLVVVVVLLLVWASPAPALASPSGVRLRGAAGGAGGCNGSIAECRGEEEEFLMDSEIHRRMLQGSQQGRYISYVPVRAGNRPVCNAGRGNSYTNNCVPPRSNEPTRPCLAYYRCRSDT